MAEAILFKITNAGKQALASGTVKLSHVAVGTTRRSATGSEVALTSEIARAPIISGGVEPISNVLRFSADITAASNGSVYEVGVFTDRGVLFAVAASNSTPFFTVCSTTNFAASFGILLTESEAAGVSVISDNNQNKPLAIMEGHLSPRNPHSQYLDIPRFQHLLDTAIPIGYLYFSHSDINPKPLFDQLLGIETYWRRVIGKTIVGTDDQDDFIKDLNFTLGQKGMTTDAINQQPHAYMLHTTHIWERHNPDDTTVTAWNVKSSKTTINEGSSVRFTVSATNIADGLILSWTVKEGLLNSERNNITTPDKSESGTVTLKGGQATIDFTTTADDNEVDPNKYVRLTIGAPASLSINVPINDLGSTETVIHITQSTTNGIQLDEYYKQASGRYPSSIDKVRFIVDAGVDIIAPNTSTPALTEGANWPAGNIPIVENHGRILGRGGNGGRSAYRHRIFSQTGANHLETYNKGNVTPPENGHDGGTAVSASQSIQIDNYNIVAGGGGGGGGMGSYKPTSGNHIVGGGGAGGGAPLGQASPNEGTYPMYLKDDTIVQTKKIPDSVFPQGANVIGIYQSIGTNSVGTKLYQLIGHGSEFYKNRIELDDIYEAKDVDETRTAFVPKVVSTNSNNGIKSYRIASMFYTADIESIALDMSQDASVDTGGQGGANYTPDVYNWISIIEPSSPSIDLKETTHGGSGGDIGVKGEDGIMTKYFSSESNEVPKESLLWHIPSASGGLAGYVKEGDVTITNYSGGTTKGR
ncbi:hypothetical protein ACTXJO_04570 [Psychrobacter celer]|uniref:hypothetical protein n=1 Tax=Psychrobacter celer TaxID=306572 RepID=UPI003FD0818F